MPKGQYLGEFELYVMAAAGRLQDDAYGMTIVREIEQRSGRRVAMGAVYATLSRLEDKGLVATRVSEPLPIPGGRARRQVRLTAAGKRALANATTMLSKMLLAPARGTGESS
jgi:DNA-binding PadR family transcriptional regulator